MQRTGYTITTGQTKRTKPFSVSAVQDPSVRKEKESVKILGKIVSEDLFNTNWRLQVSSISYRLAYLTGKLKAHESDEDLLKLAMEIGKKIS